MIAYVTQNLLKSAEKQIHVTVYLNSDPASTQAVDTAKRLAEEQNAVFTAVYVETPFVQTVKEEDRAALHDVILYAIRAGARIEILSGTDPGYLVTEYCKAHRVDQLVLTRPVRRRGIHRILKPLAAELMDRLPDIHIVTVPGGDKVRVQRVGFEKLTKAEVLRQILLIGFVMAIATLIAFFVDSTGNDESILAPIYLLAVLICSVTADKIIWPLISSTVAIILFNFLFASPRYSFAYYQRELTLVFAITFVSSIIAGAMGMQLHQESQKTKRSSWRTQVLLDTTHLLQETKETSQIIPMICSQTASTFSRDVLFYPSDGDRVGEPVSYPVSAVSPGRAPIRKEDQLALNDAIHRKAATGAHTVYYSDAEFIYLPWVVDGRVIGVLALDTGDSGFGSYEFMILDSIIQESSVSLENRIKAEEYERIRREAASNQLRSNILKGISHDLRTPLTSIIGNVTAAEEGKDFLTPDDISALWRSIKTDSQLLSSMVENLLTAARLDDNSMPIHPQVVILSDLIEDGLNFLKIANETHPLTVDYDDDLLLVNVDHSLISLVVTNMLLNAIHHTPDGTPVRIHVYEQDNQAVVDVIDEGPGISDEEKPRIFDLFYTGSKTSGFDSDHYLGLGLFLCKSIIDAHKGTISVSDNKPKGAIFSFTLPLSDMDEFMQSFSDSASADQ